MAAWDSGSCPPGYGIGRKDPRDPLDRYRDAVERCLGEYVAPSADEDFDQFFLHVITCFEAGMSAQGCVVVWLTRRMPADPP